MSGTRKEVTPVLEDLKSKNLKNLKHVNVGETVKALSEVLGQEKTVEFVAKDREINRVGMVVRQVQESVAGVEISGMKTEYGIERREDRDINVTTFRVTFSIK